MEEIHRAQSGRGGGPEDPSPLQSCHAPPDIDVFVNPETPRILLFESFYQNFISHDL